eukprot:CAMPEP_0174275828 /NCGR_PEP_ID=MMETSP0439-20130205/60051_1 /TAXON_ID=0 /ORGANISM="Stereomyxa ramosa, Strain Chinc5" /LENGTH=643 /DNA_ID=CAMNT_0015367993 /DNA_START=1571 /DNA_END=3499 /DNA_ORIENTATION=+
MVYRTYYPQHSEWVSDLFDLDLQWHHLSVIADDSRNLITFYLDGFPVGFRRYSKALLTQLPSQLPCLLTIASNPLILEEGGKTVYGYIKGRMDSISILHSPLHPLMLSFYLSKSDLWNNCGMGNSEMVEGECVPKCPHGMIRNPLAVNLGEYRSGCECAEGYEEWNGGCVLKCGEGQRREVGTGVCVCDDQHYLIWGLETSNTGIIEFYFSDNAKVKITEIKVLGPDNREIPIIDCHELHAPFSQNNCTMLFDQLTLSSDSISWDPDYSRKLELRVQDSHHLRLEIDVILIYLLHLNVSSPVLTLPYPSVDIHLFHPTTGKGYKMVRGGKVIEIEEQYHGFDISHYYNSPLLLSYESTHGGSVVKFASRAQSNEDDYPSMLCAPCPLFSFFSLPIPLQRNDCSCRKGYYMDGEGKCSEEKKGGGRVVVTDSEERRYPFNHSFHFRLLSPLPSPSLPLSFNPLEHRKPRGEEYIEVEVVESDFIVRHFLIHPLYSSPISLLNNATVTARVKQEGYKEGNSRTWSYIISPSIHPPIFLVSKDKKKGNIKMVVGHGFSNYTIKYRFTHNLSLDLQTFQSYPLHTYNPEQEFVLWDDVKIQAIAYPSEEDSKYYLPSSYTTATFYFNHSLSDDDDNQSSVCSGNEVW